MILSQANMDLLCQDKFTTGDAAKVSGVSQQTIIRLVDSGSLPSRKIPGSRFRVVNPVDLYALMRRDGIPLSAGCLGARPILALSSRTLQVETWRHYLVNAVDSSFALGQEMLRPFYSAVLLELACLTPSSLTALLQSRTESRFEHLGFVFLGELPQTMEHWDAAYGPKMRTLPANAGEADILAALERVVYC